MNFQKAAEEVETIEPKVFLTRELPETVLQYLKENAELELNQEDRVLNREEIMNGLQGKDAMICNLTDSIDAAIMDSQPNLRIIANYAVGFNNIDVEAATKRGIWVTNTPGVLTEATADMAWALLMTLSRRIIEGDQLVRSEEWHGWEPMQLLGNDVFGTNIGIIGMGRIGMAMARRSRGFHMNVYYWNRTRLDEQVEKEIGLVYCSMEELLTVCDSISLHVAYNEETHHLIGEKELRFMKKSAYIINTSRGALIDETALVQALSSKKIAGAGLDVYEHEPKLAAGLIDLPNVVLAPHLGSATLTTRTKMGIMAVNNVLALFNGLIPPNAINKIKS